MNIVRDTLIAAKQVLVDNTWTQSGLFAHETPSGVEDERLTSLHGSNPKATCFCAIGAIQRAADPEIHVRAVDYLSAALPTGQLGVALYNDSPHTTKADILALFDRAIAAAYREQT